MDTTSLPSWEDVRRDYLDPGLPHRLVVRAVPGVHAFTDTAASRLGARFEMPSGAPASDPSALEQIVILDVSADGRRWLEISTTSPALYESFYRLIGQISEGVLAGAEPQLALSEAVSLWNSLLERATVLSEERQAGLFGELMLLERLLRAKVPNAVSTWVGPDRQAHDFRLGEVEFEVKTTSGAKRIHTINGLTQLVPSLGCSLYLLSIQTTDAGSGGRSLPELVDEVQTLVPAADVKGFEARVQASGYVERHRAHYARRRRLRTDMVLIPVEDGVPRIVPDALTALPAIYAPDRIRSIIYEIDVTSLGHVDGSPEFLAVIPPAQGLFS